MKYLREHGSSFRHGFASLLLLFIMLFLTGGTECQNFFLPLFSFMPQKEMGAVEKFCDSLMSMLPICRYGQENIRYGKKDETGQTVLQGESEIMLYISEEENGEGSRQETESGGTGSILSASGELPEEAQALEALTIEELLQQENAEAAGFVPAEQAMEFDWESMEDYETLLSTFYTVDANALAGSDLLNLQSLRGRDMTLQKTEQGPQILIYHTHSREAFVDSVPGDRSQTIVGVGELLARILTEEYGYTVLHHTEEYDTVRDEAYAKSLPALERLLEDNPTIQVIIDLHRDSGNTNRNMVVDIGGRKTARFMFFNGISRSRKTGDIEYLFNPNLADNLAFSFQMQTAADEYYPGLARKIYIKQYRYNMHLKGRTLLIELGDENNTVEEAKNACYPIAHLLDMVLSGNDR